MKLWALSAAGVEVMSACDPNIDGAEGSEVQVIFSHIHGRLEANLGYINPCLEFLRKCKDGLG